MELNQRFKFLIEQVRKGNTVDTLAQTLIQQAPNLLLAVWFIVRQQKTIDALLENQTKLIDRLLGYVDKDKQAVAQMVTTAQERSGLTPVIPN